MRLAAGLLTCGAGAAAAESGRSSITDGGRIGATTALRRLRVRLGGWAEGPGDPE